jgi:hypothetical protein
MAKDRIDILREQMEKNQEVTNRSIQVLASRIAEEREIITLDELKAMKADIAKKVDKDDLKTVNKKSLIGKGDIDTTPESLTRNDVTQIFNNA